MQECQWACISCPDEGQCGQWPCPKYAVHLGHEAFPAHNAHSASLNTGMLPVTALLVDEQAPENTIWHMHFALLVDEQAPENTIWHMHFALKQASGMGKLNRGLPALRCGSPVRHGLLVAGVCVCCRAALQLPHAPFCSLAPLHALPRPLLLGSAGQGLISGLQRSKVTAQRSLCDIEMCHSKAASAQQPRLISSLMFW